MEIPHAEHNSRNSVRRLTCSKLKCYITLIRRETWVPQKEVTHQKLSQASPLMSYICPVLSRLHSPLQLFSDCYRKNRSSFANGRKKKIGRGSGLPVLTKENQGGNTNAFRPQSKKSYSSYQEMKSCRRKY